MRKTWFIDLDGTILKHRTNEEIDDIIKSNPRNSYKSEELLDGVHDFFKNIKNDCVVITTARDDRHTPHTISALHFFKIKYDKIIFGIGAGERIVLNDIKPVGDIGNKVELNMAFAYNLKRDIGVLGLNKDLENENVFTKST